MKRACKDCEWCAIKERPFMGMEPKPWTECRRNAPTIPPDDECVSGFPLVEEDDWCGEFQPREEEKPLEPSKPARPAPVPCVDMGGRPQDRTSCMDFEPYADSGLCARSGWCAMRRRPREADANTARGWDQISEKKE
jgi:hypothetical protein